MQSAVSADADRKELCLSSSSSSSAEHEDPSGWSQPRPPPVPAKPGFVVQHSKCIDAMASAQSHHHYGSSLGGLEEEDKRISSATVFEEVEPISEGLVGGKKQPLSGTMSAPLVDRRQSKMPAPPPNMDDIE